MTKNSALDFDALRPPSPFMGESHRAWRDSLRKFVERELIPHVTDWDEAGHVPREVFLKAGAFGLQDRLGWIRVVEGSESNVVGMPLELLAQMLSDDHFAAMS